jgi:hypothetical protein
MNSKLFLLLLFTLSSATLSRSQDLSEWTDSYVKGLAPARHFRGVIVVERDGKVLIERSYFCIAQEQPSDR